MAARKVYVVPTGTANLASVLAAIGRANAQAVMCEGPDDARDADLLILPGVGAFGAAMERLKEAGMIDVLKNRIDAGKPTLAICLGLQVLCEKSMESPGVKGLGVVSEEVVRLPDNVLVPQLGWNQVEPDTDCTLLEAGHAYFANSYALAKRPDGWKAAWFDHGGKFIAAIERGCVLACQFHPELSGAWGKELIARWLENATRKEGCDAC